MSNKHAGQQYELNAVHYLRKALTKDDAAAVYSLGWLPENATVTDGGAVVYEVFDAGTNNNLDIGYRNGGDGETDDTDEYATDLDLTSATKHEFDEAGAVFHFPKGAEIVADLDLTGSAATTGKVVVWVQYIVDNDGSTSGDL